MPSEKCPRQERPLVVTRDQEDRYAGFRNLDERFHHPIHERVLHPASEEQVSAVNDGIGSFSARCLQRQAKSREEIRTAVPGGRPWSGRLIEAQVSIGEEENVHAPTHGESSRTSTGTIRERWTGRRKLSR